MDHTSASISNGPTDFIQKLYRMISDPLSNSFSYWSETGNTFFIQDPHDFAKLLLPRHFKHNNFQSFIRQLNKYGFSKVKRNSEDKRWEFKHENFTRDGYATLREIKRKVASTKRVSVNSTVNYVSENPKESLPLFKNSSGMDDKFFKAYIDKVDRLEKREVEPESRLQGNLDRLMNDVSDLHKAMQSQDELMQTVVQCIVSQEKALTLFLNSQNKADGMERIFPSTSMPISANIQKLVSTYKQVSKVSGEFLDSFSKTISDIQISNTVSSSNPPFQSLEETAHVKADSQAAACNASSNDIGASSEVISNKHKTTRLAKNNENYLKLKAHAIRKRPRNEDLKWTWIVPPNVLLVDDDPTCQTIYSRSLQILGCSYEIAADGVEAVKKMQTRKYDMVLMDIWMPEMDGLSATKRIREFDRKTPIIAITGDYHEADREFYLSQGISEVLGKPLKVNELGPIMQKHWLKFCISRDAEPQLNDLQTCPAQSSNLNAFAPSLALAFQQSSSATP